MKTATDTHDLPDLTLDQIEAILARQGFIAILWGIEDVQTLRPDLTEAQCMQVLHECQRRHDASIGIHWETLEMHADDLFPRPDGDEDDDGNGDDEEESEPVT